MGFFDAFTGSSAKKYATQAHDAANTAITEGTNKAEGAYNDYYGKAQGYYAPYAESGQQANTLYGNALGLNGAGAQRDFQQTYSTSDPFRQFNEDQTSKTLARRFNSNGNMYGGALPLAISRASMERGSTDYNNYLNRLQGVQGQGLQVAGQQAGMAQNQGAQLGNLYTGAAGQKAGNEINYSNALAAADKSGMQNIMGAIGTAGSMLVGGFAPGAGGATAFGNMKNALGGGWGGSNSFSPGTAANGGWSTWRSA